MIIRLTKVSIIMQSMGAKGNENSNELFVEMYTAVAKVQILAKKMSDPQLTPESSCCAVTVLLQTDYRFIYRFMFVKLMCQT